MHVDIYCQVKKKVNLSDFRELKRSCKYDLCQIQRLVLFLVGGQYLSGGYQPSLGTASIPTDHCGAKFRDEEI